MSDCIFCKIANGEIPSSTVYEDNSFRAILDLSPANYGHCLVLPKKHGANIFELDEENVAGAFAAAKKVAAAVKEATGADGINIVQNNGEAANQTVMHLHVHIIPRFKEDKVNFSYKPFAPTKDELEQMCEKIKATLK